MSLSRSSVFLSLGACFSFFVIMWVCESVFGIWRKHTPVSWCCFLGQIVAGYGFPVTILRKQISPAYNNNAELRKKYPQERKNMKCRPENTHESTLLFQSEASASHDAEAIMRFKFNWNFQSPKFITPNYPFSFKIMSWNPRHVHCDVYITYGRFGEFLAVGRCVFRRQRKSV